MCDGRETPVALDEYRGWRCEAVEAGGIAECIGSRSANVNAIADIEGGWEVSADKHCIGAVTGGSRHSVGYVGYGGMLRARAPKWEVPLVRSLIRLHQAVVSPNIQIEPVLTSSYITPDDARYQHSAFGNKVAPWLSSY